MKIIILYCVSGYPTKIQDSNIKTINTLKKTFKNYEIGLSDHTNDITLVCSDSKWAKFIEKHFITSKKLNH